MLRVGIAMLQGARHEHAEALRGAAAELGFDLETVECRRADHVTADLDAMILPGGESTTMRIASQYESMLGALFDWMDTYPLKPVLGTCAGAILLASPGAARKPYVGAKIARNAWGRQRQSFEGVVDVVIETPQADYKRIASIGPDRFQHQPLEVQSLGADSLAEGFPGVFIRAPRFDNSSVSCTVAARLGDEVVGVQDGSKLGLTFHPELTLDRRFHRWLLNQAKQQKEAV